MCVNCGCDCETIKLPSAEDGNGVVGAYRDWETLRDWET